MHRFTPKKVLVTGGAGFIGSHFVDYLLKHDNLIEIITLDALTYAANMENLANAQASSRHTFIHGDILDELLVKTLLEEYNIDTIVHFAAESHVDRSINKPDIFIRTNVLGTQVLLEAARNFWLVHKKWDMKQCRFHMISTDEVYGSLDLNESPFTEESRYQPSSPYAASKASADHLVQAYAKTYGLPVSISNCSNNYGARQHSEKLIPMTIKACIQQNKIPVYGNGLQRRDWIHVLDHCAMINWVIREGQPNNNYNLGARYELTNIELINMLCRMADELCLQTGKHGKLINFVTDRAGHDFRYAIDAKKAFTQGCPLPEHSLENSLREMVKSAFELEKRSKEASA